MNKKKFLSVSIQKGGVEVDSVILKPSQPYLTIGDSLADDLIASIPGIPDQYRLVERGWLHGHRLLIPSGLECDIAIGSSTLPLKGLTDLGLLRKRRKCYHVPIPLGHPCLVRIGTTTLSFSYAEALHRDRRIKKIEPSLRKSLIGKENYPFMFILLVSAAINFSMAGYLRTVEIKKVEQIEALKNIPQRFAKLIFKPAEKKEVKVARLKTEEKEAPKKAEEEKKKEGSRENIVREQSQASGAADSGSGVKSKGLLGLITAKTKPDFLSDALFDTNESAQSAGPGGISGGRGAGVGSSGSRDVLAGLNVKGLDNIDLDSMSSTGHSQGKKTKDAVDILKEKRDVSIDVSEKKKVAERGVARKRDEGDVSRTVLSYVGGVKYLYNNALRNDPSLKGKITVRLVISPDGRVAKVEKVNSTLNAPELEEAIMNRVYKWQFQDAKGAEDYVITYTFDFSPTT